MYYNKGYPSDIVAIMPQGTNSTMFTALGKLFKKE